MTTDYPYLLSKMENFCSYQERCIQDVQLKLKRWKVQAEVINKIINELINEGFIDEERFAKIYAGSKLRINHWGRNKIIYELKKKNIPDLYIQMGLNDIDDDEYLNALKEIISRKDNTLKEKDLFKRKQKLASHAISKGFAANLVWNVIGEHYK